MPRRPPLKFLHSVSSFSPAKLDALRRLSDEELIESLDPASEQPLKVKSDGIIMDGHHRIFVLHERGIDVNTLPRVLYRAPRKRKR